MLPTDKLRGLRAQIGAAKGEKSEGRGCATQAGEKIIWEKVACPLCASAKEEEIIALASEPEQTIYRVARCLLCGMGYLNPRPDQSSIARFYPDDYECYRAPAEDRTGWWQKAKRRLERLVMSHHYGNPPPLRHWHQKVVALLAVFWLRSRLDPLTALPFQGQGRLLDFGCGSGWYARRMQQLGWTVTAMDFSPHSARRVMQRFAIPVLIGSLPHSAIRAESFDVITMSQVLEHVHQPHQIIAAAARALRPDGLLVVAVPNLASWGFRRFGADWWPLEVPRHLLHFTPDTLRRLVQAHGLEVRELRMLVRTNWMHRTLVLASRHGGGIFRILLPSSRRLRIIASLLARWTAWTGQADCMLLIARRPSTAKMSQDTSLRPSPQAA